MKRIKLFEEFSANQIKCGWKWKLEDGGNDVFVCHECGHDNTPEFVQEAEEKEMNKGPLDNAGINKALDKKAKEVYDMASAGYNAIRMKFDNCDRAFRLCSRMLSKRIGIKEPY